MIELSCTTHTWLQDMTILVSCTVSTAQYILLTLPSALGDQQAVNKQWGSILQLMHDNLQAC